MISQSMYNSHQPGNQYNRARIHRSQNRRRQYQRNPYWKKPFGYNRIPFQDPRMFFLVPGIYQSGTGQDSSDLATRIMDLELKISKLRDEIKKEDVSKDCFQGNDSSSNAVVHPSEAT